QILNLRKSRQRKRIEGDKRSTENAGDLASRPSFNHETGGPAGQRESGDQDDVVRENRGPASPEKRRAEHALDDQRIRIRERVPLGIENVRVEEMNRIARKLMRDPRHDPFVQEGVAVVV